MVDPLTLIAAGAAIGGATGKFVEKAWDSGEKWLADYFANHQERAKEQATENSANFLNQLAERVKALEESGVVSKQSIEDSQGHPDFSVLLHKALLSAAQTENKGKHELLARLVGERMKASPESLMAMASKMACDAISYTNSTQLKILGLQTLIVYIKPIREPPFGPGMFRNWLDSMLLPFSTLEFKALDLMHLEGMSCIKLESLIGRNLTDMLTNKTKGQFDSDAFLETELGKHIQKLWSERHLQRASLTSVGQIIGVYAFDMLTNTKTEFEDWY